MAGSGAAPYIGSKISLISNSEIRYEGILYTINSQESTIALQSVRCFGTEGRKVPEIPPSNEVYDFIIFRGQDIKDLTVLETSGGPVISDPAVISISRHPPGGKGAAAGAAASAGRSTWKGDWNGDWNGGWNSGWDGGWTSGGKGDAATAPAKGAGKGKAGYPAAGGKGGSDSFQGAGSRKGRPDASEGKGGKGLKGAAAPSGKGQDVGSKGPAKGAAKGSGKTTAKGTKGAGKGAAADQSSSESSDSEGGGKGGKGGKGSKGSKGTSAGKSGKGGKGGKATGGGGNTGAGGKRGGAGAAPVGELVPQANADIKREVAEAFDFASSTAKFEKVAADETGVQDPKLKPLEGYDKGKSFFDNISCQATERTGEAGRIRPDSEKADQETFGDRDRRGKGARRGRRGAGGTQ